MVGQLFRTFIDSGCVEIVQPMSTLEYRVGAKLFSILMHVSLLGEKKNTIL